MAAAQQQSRPEPMNVVTHHAKVRTTLRFAELVFVAGGMVTGKMEMECKTDKGLAIGVIMVELYAIEELTSRDHSATQTFLHSRRIFQGPGLPPSNSVHPLPLPGEPPLPSHYYHARRGITTFLFRFPLPESSPSAINFGSGLAQLRYEVRATIGVVWKGERRLVQDKKTIDVVEAFYDDPSRPEPEGVIVGENGKIWMQAKVLGGMLIAGQPACVELTVKNHSSKKNSGLSVTLSRELFLPGLAQSQKQPLQISDTLTSVSFRGPEFIIQPGVEGVANLVVDVPRQARSVKGGQREGDEEEGRTSANLFEVRCSVAVCMSMGFGSKDIHLQLPVRVYHPIALPALPSPPQSPMVQPVLGMFAHDLEPYYQPPISPVPYMAASPPIPGYLLPPMTPPPITQLDQGHVWLPPPASPLPNPYATPVRAPYYEYGHPANYSPYHISPARPSSAEPMPSLPLYPPSAGLPPSIVPQPLVPVMTGGTGYSPERAEGKGERASRITHHLRMSSRNRSVSPVSHRYAMPAAPLPEPDTSAAWEHQQTPLDDTPTNSKMSPPAHININSDVASPRPMPSPKQTYSVDPLTHLTFSKSERVETLERIAADTDRAFGDMSENVPDLKLDRDKTLPKPPSAAKDDTVRQGPRSLDIPFSDDDYDKAPPTPTLPAFASSKASRVALGQLGGLDALEARLLAEVGTRKPEQDIKKPDVRSVLPIAIPSPNAVPDPAIDSAISSLSLPGVAADEGTLRLGQGSPLLDTSASERARPRTRDGDPSVVNAENGDVSSSGRQERKKGSQSDRGSATKEKEHHRLRKAARGRVAAWLGSIEPDEPPLVTTPPTGSPKPAQSTDIPEDVLAREPSQPYPKSPSPSPPERKPEAQVDAKPNPRSSGFMPIGNTLKAKGTSASPGAAAPPESADLLRARFNLPQRLQDPEVRYDVRSARGGKGGQVTAIATFWAQQQASSPSPTPPKPPPSKPAPAPIRKPIAARPAMMQMVSAPKAASPAMTDLGAKRANAAKSSSVPAIVSSSLATPMISTTASLARPTPQPKTKTANLPPTISEAIETKKADAPKSPVSPKAELAFGQARLRELIRKYQG